MYKRKTARSFLALPLLVGLAACSSGIQQDAPLYSEEGSLSTQATVVVSSVPDSASDAEEDNSGRVGLTSTILEFGYKNPSTSEKQTVGLRFTNINIPKGATVTDARIEFVAPLNRSETTLLKIYGNNVANAQTFVDRPNDITGRAKTSAFVDWKPGTWTAERKYASPNLASIVGEISSRPDWVKGAAMAFVISGTGYRKAYAYEAPGAQQPVLRVYYQSPTTNPPPTASKSCLENVNRTVANPKRGEQYDIKGKGKNAEIDARGKEFIVPKVNNSRPKPMVVQNNGEGLCISGGKYSTNLRDDAPWEPQYHFGPAIYVLDSPGFVMDNLAIYIGGDTIHIEGGTNKWTVRDSYIRHAGDDAFSNDRKTSGLIDDVLVDWAYTGISCRNEGMTEIPGTVTIQDSLIALKKQKGTYNNHKDDTYPENPGHFNLFKFEVKPPGAKNCKLRLRDTVLYITQNDRVFKSIQNPKEYVLECKNVTLVYAGDGNFRDGKGWLAELRNKFKAINNEQEPSCFKVLQGSEGIRFWKQKRDDWFKRHTSNSQISAYRYQEPSGAN